MAYTFQDEFNGASGSAPDPAKWQYATGTGVFGTGETETMTSSRNNSYIDGASNLVIAALSDGTSARLESVALGATLGHGSYAARIKIENVVGFWPAFWMMGNQGGFGAPTWPANGEIDIMETYGSGYVSHTVSSGTVFTGGAHAGIAWAPPEEFDVYNNGTWGGNSGSASAVPGGFPNPFDGNFHVWRMDWPDDTKVQFFIDDIPCGNSSWGSGNGVFTNTNMTAQGNGASWPYTMAITGGLYFILNVATGPVAGVTGTPVTFPYYLTVDYVRGWTPAGPDPGGTVTPAVLAASAAFTAPSPAAGETLAISVVQTTSGYVTSSGPVTMTLGTPTTAGNCLVVCAANMGTGHAVSGVTLGLSAGNFAKAAGIVSAEIWADDNCAGGQTSLAVTFSSDVDGAAAVAYEVSGLAASGLVDKSSSDSGTGTANTSGSTATTTAASEIWVGLSNTAGTITGPSPPWINTDIIDFDGSYNDTLATGYQIVSSTGTATYALTSVSTAWVSAVVTLRAAAAPVIARPAPLAGTAAFPAPVPG